MTHPSQPSLAARLLVSLSLGVLCTFIATEAVIVWRTRVSVAQALRDALSSRAAALAALIELDNDEDAVEIEFEAAPGALSDYAEGNDAAFAITCTEHRDLVRSPAADAMLGPSSILRTEGGVDLNRAPIFWTHTTSTQRVEVVALHTIPHPEHHPDLQKAPTQGPFGGVHVTQAGAPSGGECLVIVGLDRAPYEARERDMLFITAPTLGVGLFVLLLLAAVVVRWGLRPLTALSNALAQRSAEHLDPLPPPNIAELAQVTAALNNLIARLNTSFTSERHFMANVAHELRTPITELSTLAQVTLPTLPLDSPQRPDYEDILAATSRMSATLTTMMTLSRCDTGRLPIKRLPLDLCALTLQLWAELADKASARGLSLASSLPPNASITNDPNALQTILHNLLANAVAYSPVDTTITLELDLTPDTFALRIINPAPTLTRDDLAHLFERFWRQDPYRDGAPGGLGLPLSLALSQALSLTLSARLTPETPNALVMELSGPRHT